MKDRSPISTFEEVRNRLTGNKIFSRFDLRMVTGKWDLTLRPRSSRLLAQGPQFGLWEWTVLPFCLSNGPNSFQRELQSAFSDLNFVVKVYVDDIFLHSATRENHIHHLELFFRGALLHI